MSEQEWLPTSQSDMRAIVMQHTRALLELGSILYTVKVEKTWEDYAKTWASFLADPEYSINQPMATDCILAYKVFRVNYPTLLFTLYAIPWQKLVVAAKYLDGESVVDGARVDEVLGDALALSKSDLEIKLGMKKEGQTTPNSEPVKVRLVKEGGVDELTGTLYRKSKLCEVDLREETDGANSN